jgi:hypothetical protein
VLSERRVLKKEKKIKPIPRKKTKPIGRKKIKLIETKSAIKELI